MDDSPGPEAMPEIRIGETADVVEMLAADLETHARHSLSERRPFTLAIPGGSVARTCFPRLAVLELDWSNIELFWVDERAVPPGDPNSNYGLARALWLEPARVPAGRVHRMRGEADDLDRAAQEYANELTRNAGAPPRLDYVLLGVGADGHVASLFPGQPALAQKQSVLAIEDAPRPPPCRLSLSLPVLMNARRVVVVAFGTEKAPVIREAVEDGGSPLPVAQVARGARRCLFLLDRAAGNQVERG